VDKCELFVRPGEASAAGPRSVVTKDVPAGAVAVGNPARVVRKVTD